MKMIKKEIPVPESLREAVKSEHKVPFNIFIESIWRAYQSHENNIEKAQQQQIEVKEKELAFFICGISCQFAKLAGLTREQAEDLWDFLNQILYMVDEFRQIEAH